MEEMLAFGGFCVLVFESFDLYSVIMIIYYFLRYLVKLKLTSSN